MSVKTIVIAGTSSNCGKTTVALALMAALTRKGLVVQPFKAGPDFIDPGHHQRVTGRTSHNLDAWMMGKSAVAEVFARATHGADVAVVEGAMGLFDGLSGTSEEGSTAQLAKLLGAPAVLVADASSMARSAAALVSGYADFDPDLHLGGVIFNRVGSDRHARILAEALSIRPGIALLGQLRRNADLTLPSRHLGLVTAGDHALADKDISRLADWLEQDCDTDQLLATASNLTLPIPAQKQQKTPRVRLGVARDAAFCFYYAQNLWQLEQAGAELVYFSPLKDMGLPPALDGLYLGGGYPELHAGRLAANASMRRALKDFCASNRPVYAECGGFMTLMQGLTDKDGTQHPMADVFSCRASMGPRFRALGYRCVTTTAATLLGPAGTTFRGHEFHYSALDGPATDTPTYALSDRNGPMDPPEGFLVGKTLGSYVHAHFASNPAMADAFVQACVDAGAP